jgi:hypothetical protein
VRYWRDTIAPLAVGIYISDHRPDSLRQYHAHILESYPDEEQFAGAHADWGLRYQICSVGCYPAGLMSVLEL